MSAAAPGVVILQFSLAVRSTHIPVPILAIFAIPHYPGDKATLRCLPKPRKAI